MPSLGEASDGGPNVLQPDAKKTAFDVWRNASVPSMEIVFRGSNHLQWGQGAGTPVDLGDADPHLLQNGTTYQRFEYYTRAWFDLWLKGDATAKDRLMATDVLGTPTTDLLSTKYRSAAFLPGGGVDCADLAACV